MGEVRSTGTFISALRALIVLCLAHNVSELEFVQSIERWEYVAFKVVQAVLFCGGLWQVIDWKFRIKETVLGAGRKLLQPENSSMDKEPHHNPLQ